MRMILWLLLLSLYSVPGWSAISLVQQCAAVANSTSVTCTMPANVTAGNFLVASYTIATTTDLGTAPTGCTATFTQAIRNGTNKGVEIWYCTNATGGSTTISCKYDGKSGANACNVTEWTGMATSSPGDGAGNTNSGSSANPATGNLTTGNADDLLVGAMKINSGTYSSGPTNSFNRLTAPNATSEMAYRIVSSTGTYATDWTFSGSTTWGAAIFAFKAAAAGGTVVKDVIMRGRIAAPR